jgi:hypothetical protein
MEPLKAKMAESLIWYNVNRATIEQWDNETMDIGKLVQRDDCLTQQ